MKYTIDKLVFFCFLVTKILQYKKLKFNINII